MSKKDKEIFEKYWFWGLGGLHRKELYKKCFRCTKDGKEITLDELDNYIYEYLKENLMKRKKKKKLVIIEKTVYIDGKKVYLMSYHKWAKNKIHLFFIILYCKIMLYKYEII